MGEATKAITFRLPEHLYESLRREAYETRTPMNTLVINAITTRYPTAREETPQ